MTRIIAGEKRGTQILAPQGLDTRPTTDRAVSYTHLDVYKRQTKDDLRENYPYGMFAVPMKQIVRVHGSSGTTGNPTIVGYTRHDLDMWTGLVSRIACAAGVVPDDIAQISRCV